MVHYLPVSYVYHAETSILFSYTQRRHRLEMEAEAISDGKSYQEVFHLSFGQHLLCMLLIDQSRTDSHDEEQ